MKKLRRFGIILAALLIATLSIRETKATNITELVQETQRFEEQNDRFVFVWWIPLEYWEISLENDPSLSPEQVEEFIQVLDDYLIFAVADARINTFGTINSISREEIVQNITIKNSQGKIFNTIPETQQSQDLKNFLSFMKPFMTNFLGQFGSSIEFVVFPGKNNSQERLFDPFKEEVLNVNYNQSTYTWRLPLGSLLPPKYDSETGEKFPGNYNYNPFTGTILKLRE